jgi:hypothetical protein
LQLPHLNNALIEDLKLSGYLLSDTHPTGRFKAAFFRQFGFRVDAIDELKDALVAHATAHDVSSLQQTRFGTKYRITGTLRSPDGRDPNVCAVWFIATGADAPRLVTVFPA